MSTILYFDSGEAWNYSDPNQPDYQPTITGTVVEIRETQSYNYKTKQPEFWPEGNPKLNLTIVIQDQTGREYLWTFMPRRSNAAKAAQSALKAYNPSANSIADIAGLMIEVSTSGSTVSLGNNPRPWACRIIGPGAVPFRGITDYQPPAGGYNMQPQQQTNPVQAQQNMAMYGQPVPPAPLQRDFNGNMIQQPQVPMQQMAPVQYQAQPQTPMPVQQSAYQQTQAQNSAQLQQPVVNQSIQQPQPTQQQPQYGGLPTVAQVDAAMAAGSEAPLYDKDIPF